MANLTPRILVAVIVIAFVLFYPSSQPSPADAYLATTDIILHERENLQSLNAFSANDFNPIDAGDAKWLNLTGLRKTDNFAWALLPLAKEALRSEVQRIIGTSKLESLDDSSNASLPLYKNVTGWLQGQWTPLPIPDGLFPSQVNLSIVAPNTSYVDAWERNITGREGKIQLRLNEKDISEFIKDSTAYISGTLTIQDDTSYGDGWELTLHGVHDQADGSVMLTTTSEKYVCPLFGLDCANLHRFAGIFALPYLAPTTSLFEKSRSLLNKTLSYIIDAQQEDGSNASPNPWRSQYTSDAEMLRKPSCEIVMYLQQHPIDIHSNLAVSGDTGLELIETELRDPSGIHLAHPPALKMSMVAFSPDCGFFIKSKGPPQFSIQEAQDLTGYKLEIYISLGKRVIFGFIVVLGLQVMLLVRELKAVSTPSMQSRLSFYTVAMLSLGNAFTWVAFLTTAFFSDSFYLPMLTAAFFAFLEGSFFGMKFLMEIWSVQALETIARNAQGQRLTRTIPPDPTTQASDVNDRGSDTLPLPVTARRPEDTGAVALGVTAQPHVATTPIGGVVNQADQGNSPRSFGILYTKYYLFLLLIIFVSINAATSWPRWIRSLYANVLSLLYLSFWVPQIYRNILRNNGKAFSWQFVVGQSLLRLAPFVYVWGVKSNVLFVDTDLAILMLFLGWVGLQVLALLGQELLGPRVLVKDSWKWVPVAWNYHPVLRQDDEGATLPLGFIPTSPTLERIQSPADDERQRLHTGGCIREFECAICMQKAKVTVTAGEGGSMSESFGSTSSREVLGRRNYMVTPCRHIFHTNCLESWMKYRLACPICRSHLPQ